MNKIVLFVLLFCTVFIGFSQKRIYQMKRTNEAPKIDGVLDDEVWTSVNKADSMLQYVPNEGDAASFKTEVKLLYDNKAIYVYAMCYDDSPEQINKELGARDYDNITADEFFIGFDTYNTYDAYVFGVSASGIQKDVKDSDPTYNAVWQSAVKINNLGWAIEMRIPYSAIRFPSAPEQEWGFQFTRRIIRTGEYNQWALCPKTASNSRMHWGVLKGIKNIEAPLRLSMTPFITAGYDNTPFENNNGSISYNSSYSYNAGADLKWGIDEKFTIDVTLFPDFSQVQSDNKIKTLSYSEVTYTDNREFFKEGTELFNKNSMFYTRRIGAEPKDYRKLKNLINKKDSIIENPSKTKLLNAIKLSGRNNNGLGIGIFNAITNNMYAIVQDSIGNKRKILTEPFTNYNIVVFDQKLKRNSSLYFMNTNVIRSNKYADANVSALGFTLNNKNNSYAIDGNATLSQQFDTTKQSNLYENNIGYKYFLGARKIKGNFQFGYSHTLINKTYNSSDMGYYLIPNQMRNRLYFSYNIFKPNVIFRESYNNLSFDYNLNPETNKSVFNRVAIDLYAQLLNYWDFSIGMFSSPIDSWDYYEPRTPGRYSRVLKFYYTYADLSTDYRKPLQLSFHVEYGDFLENFSGIGIGYNTGIRYRFNDKAQIKYTFNYNDDKYNLGFVEKIDDKTIIYGGRELITYINTLNFKYIFKNDLLLTFNARHYWYSGKYLEYFYLMKDGNYLENNNYKENNNFSYNAFNVDIAFSWQFAPGSNLSLVYKNAIENENNILTNNFSKNFDNTLRLPQSNNISLRLLYYLDYQNIVSKRNS